MTAKQMLRTRYMGTRGSQYQTLAPSDKMGIDKAIDRKVGIIKKIAQRLVPIERQRELSRFMSVKTGQPRKESKPIPLAFGDDLDHLFSQRYSGLSYDQFKLVEQHAANEISNKSLGKLIDISESSQVPLDIIEQIMLRGVADWYNNPKQTCTAEQNGFHRVHSFINQGLAFHLDSDLAEGLKDPKDNPCWKGFKPVGTKMKRGKEVPNCVPEEVNLDEISTATKMRYVGKAATSTNEPKDGESQSQYLERIHKRMSGIKKALSKVSPSSRFQKEEGGAGEEGTMKLVKKYTKDTPGQC
jgi:hypothetical protein